MGLLSLFSKSAINSLKKVANEMQQTINEIDFDDFENRFDALRNDINKEFEKFTNKLKNLGNKYVVEVPYDRDRQTLSYRIENGLMTITVETNEETENGSFKSKSTTTTTIPEDVNVDNIIQKYLKDEKKMLFILKKTKIEVVEEDENEVEEETPLTNEQEELVKKMYHMRKNGCSYRKIGLECGVSDKTAKKWIDKYILENEE